MLFWDLLVVGRIHFLLWNRWFYISIVWVSPLSKFSKGWCIQKIILQLLFFILHDGVPFVLSGVWHDGANHSSKSCWGILIFSYSTDSGVCMWTMPGKGWMCHHYWANKIKRNLITSKINLVFVVESQRGVGELKNELKYCCFFAVMSHVLCEPGFCSSGPMRGSWVFLSWPIASRPSTPTMATEPENSNWNSPPLTASHFTVAEIKGASPK